MSILYTVSLLISTIFLIVYFITKRKYKYWEKKNVPYAKPLPIVGNYGEFLFLKKYVGSVLEELCHQFPDEPYFGTYFGTEPALVVKDPELLKLVLTKDFYYFNGREVSDYADSEAITQNLLFNHGDHWKVVRQNLTPLFTSAKMKGMFHMIEKCNKALLDMLDYETSGTNVVEAKSLMSRYTMDCITSCAFGVEANAMAKSQANNPFKQIAVAIFNPTTWGGLKIPLRLMWPGIFYGLGIRWFPKMISDFFHNVMMDVFKKRDYKPSQRNDFVDSVLTFKQQNYIVGDSLSNLKTGGNEKVQLKVSDDLLSAQCALFFAAGFETSSTALTLTLFELAKNKVAQTRAIEEVDAYLRRHDGKIGYNCVTELPYVNACLYETSRFYPVFGLLSREVMEDYTFPSGLKVEKGTRIHIPTSYIHKDPRNYPDPLIYKPERFMPDAKENIKPYTNLIFGEGQRLCMGMRFAKMQGVSGMATILSKYKVELAEGMSREVASDPKIYIGQPSCDINIKLIGRD